MPKKKREILDETEEIPDILKRISSGEKNQKKKSVNKLSAIISRSKLPYLLKKFPIIETIEEWMNSLEEDILKEIIFLILKLLKQKQEEFIPILYESKLLQNFITRILSNYSEENFKHSTKLIYIYLESPFHFNKSISGLLQRIIDFLKFEQTLPSQYQNLICFIFEHFWVPESEQFIRELFQVLNKFQFSVKKTEIRSTFKVFITLSKFSTEIEQYLCDPLTIEYLLELEISQEKHELLNSLWTSNLGERLIWISFNYLKNKIETESNREKLSVYWKSSASLIKHCIWERGLESESYYYVKHFINCLNLDRSKIRARFFENYKKEVLEIILSCETSSD